MSVSPQKRIFKCWSCGAGGDVIRFIQLFERVDFREALATLARRLGLDDRTAPTDNVSGQQREALRAVITWARQRFQHNLHATNAGKQALDYAHRRGLTDATIERFGLGLALDGWSDVLDAARHAGYQEQALHQAGLITNNEQGRVYDRFRNRLVFPITDALGRVVAFGGRTLGDDPAKYLNSPETPLFSKSRILYGLQLARQAVDQQRAVIVVEGYMDAVLLAQFGFENVVATLGTALTDSHSTLLRSRADTLYLCFDGDAAGIRAADRAVEVALRTQADVRVVLLDAGKDPADCVLEGGAEAFAGHLKRAVDALEFKWSQTVSAYGAGGSQGRRVAVEAYLTFVAGAMSVGGSDPLQQNLLVGRLSELLGVPSEAVFEMLAGAKRSLPRRAAQTISAEEAASTYERSTRTVPGGLVTAVETIFGLLLTDVGCWQWVDDTVARAVSYSQTWDRLYRVLLEVHSDMGEYSIGDIVSQCDDSALCEVVDRSCARTRGVSAPGEHFLAARERVATELSLLRARERQEALRQSGGDDGAVFRSLHEDLRGSHSVLPAETQWNATSSPN